MPREHPGVLKRKSCVLLAIQSSNDKWSTKQWGEVQRESTNRLKTISLRSIYDKEPCCMGSVYQRPMGRRPSLFLNSPHHPRWRPRRNTRCKTYLGNNPPSGSLPYISLENVTYEFRTWDLSIPENGNGCYPAPSERHNLRHL